MTMSRSMRLLPIVLFSLLWSGASLVAQSGEMSVLQNLPAVGVVVRGLSSDGAKLGLTESELIAAVREPLEAAGVRIIPPPMLERTPEAPLLEISANVSQSGRTSYFYILDLQLREPVKPPRVNRTLVTVPAVTWAQQKGGVTANPENVGAALAQLAQRFADEWTEARRAQ